MRFTATQDTEAVSLRDELASRALGTDAPGLMTANLWLWDVEPASSASDPRVVVVALLGRTGMPCRDLLEAQVALGPWVSLAPEAARKAAMRLLTSETSLEIAAFDEEPRQAALFVDRLFAWVGSPVAALASMDHRADDSAAGFSLFRVPHWVDEGLVFIGPARVGLLWFVGTD